MLWKTGNDFKSILPNLSIAPNLFSFSWVQLYPPPPPFPLCSTLMIPMIENCPNLQVRSIVTFVQKKKIS